MKKATAAPIADRPQEATAAGHGASNIAPQANVASAQPAMPAVIDATFLSRLFGSVSFSSPILSLMTHFGRPNKGQFYDPIMRTALTL